MKAVVCSILIAAVVLPVLSISKAYAGPGSPFPRPPLVEDRQSLLFGRDPLRDPLFNQAPVTSWSNLDGDRDQVSDERMFDGWGNGLNNDEHRPAGNSGGGTSAPLDGGISLLLAAGLGLGMKKAMRKKKSSEEEVDVIPVADGQI
jgi:hypothetical protein